MMLLSIGIPTYNRASKLKVQLSFLYDEFAGLSAEDKSRISFFVFDNCSTDNTKDVVAESRLFVSECVNCTYHCNSENLGLTGNLQRLYSELDGEYLWVIGDDDLLKRGIVRRVLEECIKHTYDYIFINHSIVKNETVVKESVLEGIDTSRTDKAALWELYKKSGTVMMLISACVYRTSLVKQYISTYDVNMVIPCSLSFFCASKGKTCFICSPLIINDQTVVSWEKSLYKVFYFFVPSLLLKLPGWGYNKKECYHNYIVLKRRYLRKKIKGIAKKIMDCFKREQRQVYN